MSRYANDPRWLQVRYPSTCEKCKAPIAKGERAFYFPSSRSLQCKAENCGEKASREFDAAAADEAFYNGGY